MGGNQGGTLKKQRLSLSVVAGTGCREDCHGMCGGTSKDSRGVPAVWAQSVRIQLGVISTSTGTVDMWPCQPLVRGLSLVSRCWETCEAHIVWPGQKCGRSLGRPGRVAGQETAGTHALGLCSNPVLGLLGGSELNTK